MVIVISHAMDKESMLPKHTRLESIRYANHTKKEGASTARMEDYLEVIYELVEHKGYATTIDISEYLNVSSPGVSRIRKVDVYAW